MTTCLKSTETQAAASVQSRRISPHLTLQCLVSHHVNARLALRCIASRCKASTCDGTSVYLTSNYALCSSMCMPAGKWRATIKRQGVQYHLGSHTSEEQVLLLAFPVHVSLRSCALQFFIRAQLFHQDALHGCLEHIMVSMDSEPKTKQPRGQVALDWSCH